MPARRPLAPPGGPVGRAYRSDLALGPSVGATPQAKISFAAPRSSPRSPSRPRWGRGPPGPGRRLIPDRPDDRRLRSAPVGWVGTQRAPPSSLIGMVGLAASRPTLRERPVIQAIRY